MPARFHVELPLAEGHVFDLPADAVRHVHVRRLQLGAPVVLFNGNGGEWLATIGHVGRDEVQVRVGRHETIDRELRWHVTLAVAMPANDRMDGLIEKATELGVAAVQPLVSERSVLRLAGERAVRKRVHWQTIAAAACEQSGRTRLPRIEPVRAFVEWLAAMPDGALEARWVLSLRGARPLSERVAEQAPGAVVALSGPEGGLTAAEEIAAFERGFSAVNLGPRVLRADTAPLAMLAALAVP
jgi:16S rRNA (uracil1498-N3)-methyltransferase